MVIAMFLQSTVIAMVVASWGGRILHGRFNAPRDIMESAIRRYASATRLLSLKDGDMSTAGLFAACSALELA